MSTLRTSPPRLSRRARFSRLSPLWKLGIWAAGMVTFALAVESIAWASGIRMTLLDNNTGGTVLVVVALVSLLAVLSTERRPLVEYGLVAPQDWRRQAIIAAAMGGGAYLAYCLVACELAVFEFSTAGVTPLRLAKAMLAAISAVPIAAVQQIIFTGLLVGMLRHATGNWLAILVPAVTIAAFAGLAKEGGLAGEVGQRLFIAMTLLAALLALLRLLTGSIVVPAGLLAGAIGVRKVIAKLRLLEWDPSAAASPWLAPSGDPRQGPAMWLVLAVAIAAAGILLYRYGERLVAEDATVAESFKRIMPFSNLLAFAPIDRWLVELARARFKVGLAYIPRLIFTLAASSLTTVVALPERLIAPRLLKHNVPPPVFIVGMHRSGTTYLHELLALDSQFRSPRNYEVFNPHGFLSGWLTTAAMSPLLMWRRPMDAVQMTVLSSQEEEFALAAMGGESPYWMLCFPQQIGRVERFWHPGQFTPRELQQWQRNYLGFLRKLTWRNLRTPLLKNPVNTTRVATLRSMFPDAKFIYLVRHPYAVYQSNLHFARHGFAVFQLQDPNTADNYETRILHCYRTATEACQRDLAALPLGHSARIRFEDLESTPLGEIERLYCELGLEISPAFRDSLTDYLARTSGYRKNSFAELPAGDREKVDAAMGRYLLEWGYLPVTNSAAPNSAAA